jgi:hypothetical protein
MQARVRQHLAGERTQALRQTLREQAADEFGRGHAAGFVRVGLGDVVLGQLRQRRVGLRQAGRGHAPGADAGAQQVHRWTLACEPMAEDEAVQRQQRQPLGATGRSGDGGHMRALQAVFQQMRTRQRPGVHLQRQALWTAPDRTVHH